MKHVKTFGGGREEGGKGNLNMWKEKREKSDRGGIKENKATREKFQTLPSKRACMTSSNPPCPSSLLRRRKQS